MRIGDLFLRVLADDKGFQADLVKKSEKAGDAAGRTLGQRMSAGVKAHGAKIIGTTLAAGFGIATKGLLELEQVTADFAAATGASADEADRAGRAINEMAGRNLQPVTEIGEALTKVTTDLGLSGEEAERTTQRFLRFARATKQNAARAVVAFDDILDAWGLTAADAGDIMDKLVVSSQQYGGSIEDNQRALAELAPSLRAANLTVDDGIGLLNLFAESGVDSAAAVTGMTKALSKVKSPEELQALIADIIATEDPFLRAEKAADLFGVRAGAKLANVLRPGIGGLQEFAISTDEAAGATERAADVLDSTLGARFQLLMKSATSAITGFGANFGPALTGMASLASLGGSLGGGRLVGAIGGGLAGAWRKVAATPVVAKAIAFAGGKAATVYLAALIAGDRISAALSAAFAKVASSGPVAAATTKAGMFLGTAVGTAFSGAFAAAATIGVVLALKEIGTGAKEEFDKALFGADRAGQAKEFERILREEGMAAATAYLEGLGAGLTDVGGLVAETHGNITGGFRTATKATDGMTDSLKDLGGQAKTTSRWLRTAAHEAAEAFATYAGRILGEARDTVTTAYDIIDAKAALNAANVEAAELRKVIATGNATREQKDRYRELGEEQATLILDLAANGVIAGKSVNTAMDQIRERLKTATGNERKALLATLAVLEKLRLAAERAAVKIAAAAALAKLGLGSQGLIGGNWGPTGKAAGGPVQAGVPYWVGERGPEIVVPRVAATVIPHAQSMDIAATQASGGETTITIYNPEPRAADDDIGRMLRRVGSLGITGR